MSARRLLLCLVAASSLALSSSPAHAETLKTADAAHDVRLIPERGTGIATPVPERIEGDVLRMRVAHGKKAVRVTMRLAQLTRDVESQVIHSFAFRTNQNRLVGVDLYVADGNWQGQRTWIGRDHGRQCRGLRTHVDYRADSVTVVVPRRCLSNPRWVRVGAGVGQVSGSEVYADDAHLDGQVKHNLALGSRVLLG